MESFGSLKKDRVSRSMAKKKQSVYETNLKLFQEEQFLGAFQNSKKAKKTIGREATKDKKESSKADGKGNSESVLRSKRKKRKSGLFALTDGLDVCSAKLRRRPSSSGESRNIKCLELVPEKATILHHICAQVLRHKVTS
eukprot:GHVS01054410.1.p1 GENE.GHVS01054410.1~~GHVS01054410.1.p1  ORF type:complete len:140 (+),score=11.68 GHVS01054410.1:183-602(+)